jgi:hypothetical protein
MSRKRRPGVGLGEGEVDPKDGKERISSLQAGIIPAT